MDYQVILACENSNQAKAFELLLKDIGVDSYVLEELSEFERLCHELTPSMIIVDETVYKGLLNNYKHDCLHIVLGEVAGLLEGHQELKKPIRPQVIQQLVESRLSS
jgi:hypothetical protein